MMKNARPAAKLALVVVTVLLSALALGLLVDQPTPAAETAPTFFHVGQSYAVSWASASTWDVTVMELGRNGWVKVKERDGRTYWLNANLLGIIREK
jgi:hypothetical protein